MIQEKNITPPNEPVAEQELSRVTNTVLTPAELKQQKNYEERLEKFIKGIHNLEDKYKIKLLQIPARIIYEDNKYEKNK